MDLKLNSYGSLCELAIFIINDQEALWEDFGDKYDADPDNAEEYGCGNMIFEPYDPKQEILSKYKINEEEYQLICEKLREELSFGACGCCV